MLARIVNATARPMARVASTPAPWDIHSLTSLKLSPRGALSFVHGHYSMRRSLATKSLSAMTAPEHERLAKSIARSDLGLSRREAERYIDEGRVVVNGSKIGTPAVNVEKGDKILVDGKNLTFYGTQTLQVYIANKLPGELVTASDPMGRPTLANRLRMGKGLKRLIPQLCFVGRLDFMSEGLIMLTNHGGLARKLEHPENAIERRYRVRVHGSVPPWKLAAFARGCTIDGVRYKPMRATMEPRTERGPGFREKGESSTSQSAKQRRLGTRPRKGGKLASSLKNQNNSSSSSGKGGSNTWLKIACHEGKNRQIRKVCAHFGLTVNRLIRTGYGPYDLEGCDRGALLKVDAKMILAVVENSHLDSGLDDDFSVGEEGGYDCDDEEQQQQQVSAEWGVLGVGDDFDSATSTSTDGDAINRPAQGDAAASAAPATIPVGVFRRRGRTPLTSQGFKAVAAAKAAKENAQLRRRFVK